MAQGKERSSPSGSGSHARAGQNGAKSSKKDGRATAAPKRKDMISLGEEKLPVRRSPGKVEKVSADVLMLEGAIQRALGQQSFSDVVELYRRLDDEETTMSAGCTKPSRTKRPTAKNVAQCRAALGGMVRSLGSRQDELIHLGVAEFEYGVLVMNPELRLKVGRAAG